MTADEAKEAFLDMLVAGVQFIPVGACDNFDPRSGCLGHPPGGQSV